jgi:ABC-type antimicrobial peptide transport system permease subunit
METVRVAPIWLALRADLRRKWRALLSLALLLGLAGGVVLTAAAGARRTDTAYPRLLTWANASQVDVVPGGPSAAFFAALARQPQVAAMSSAIEYNVGLPVPGAELDTHLEALASPDDTVGVSVDRVKITQGAMFSPGAAGEAVIDSQLAAMAHLRPGSTLWLFGIPYDSQGNVDLAHKFPLTFTVTGIAAFDDQVVPATVSNAQPRVLLTPAFSRTKAAGMIVYLPEAGLRLRAGTDEASFAARVRQLAGRYPQTTTGFTYVVNLADEVVATQRAIRPQAAALAVFGGLAGLICLAVIAQLLARQLALDSAEFPVLRSVGMTRRSLLALALARLAVVTIAGAVLAVAVAVAASPLMPIGSARVAEPDPGVEVNAAILAAGFAVIAVVPLALLARPAWRTVSHALEPLGVAEPAAGRTRRSLPTAVLTPAGLVTSGVGMRMAFEPGRGRTAVPVRSALAGTVIALTALVAAVVFGASLAGLVGTPGRYGQNWDASLNIGFAGISGPFGARLLSTQPAITGYAAGSSGQVTIDGTIVPAIGIDQQHGDGYLTLLAGRSPASPGEIALGAQTLRALHRQIGQSVQVAVTLASGSGGPGTPHPMRIVGTAVFPDFGLPGLTDTDLGNGALIATSLLSEKNMPATGCGGHVTCYNLFLLRYRPGTDLAAADTRLLNATQQAGCPISSCTVMTDQRPGDIKNYAAIRETPLALAAALAVLAVGTLAHVLLTGVRRRRHDLALLKTLGFTRFQVQGVVAWQGTALAAAALAAGIPLGIIAGRLAWAVFANAAGVASQATVDLPLVLLAIPVTLLLANVIAAWPGWTAARLRPATVLRTE